jgi:hypothetical protein
VPEAFRDASDVNDGGKRRDGGRAANTREASEPPVQLDATVTDVYPVYQEDVCSDAPLQVPSIECDPLASNLCRQGLACYPTPPRGTDDCHPGRYGTSCLRQGRGTQGSPCSNVTDCVAGFMCVKTGAGDQCVKICRLNQYGSCSDGRICREVDVTGSEWGGCD